MLRKLLRKCAWFRHEADSDQQGEQQFNDNKVTGVPHSVTETTFISELTVQSDSGSSFQQTNTFIKRRTPVLFSTNRGLHLRIPKLTSPGFSESSSSSNGPTALYDVNFCDLERWSTNRAHTVSLEDTFTIARQTLEPVEEHPTSTSRLNYPNRSLGSSQCCGSNSSMAVKHSVRFNNTYARFETGQ